MVYQTEVDNLAAKYPNLARCYRCRRPIDRTPKSEEPVLCGPCIHLIREKAGYEALAEYRKNMK